MALPRPSWESCGSLLAFAEVVRQELKDLRPRDMTAIPSFAAAQTVSYRNTAAAVVPVKAPSARTRRACHLRSGSPRKPRPRCDCTACLPQHAHVMTSGS